jgi:ribosomal protein S18 acetylase RimI-like enzyme
MFFARPKLTARPATGADRDVIAALARFERRVHTHLDWRPVEGWLGAQPFFLAEQGRRVMGALACPPDPPDTAWVRLLALADQVSADEIWDLLWGVALPALTQLGARGAAGLSTGQWMKPLYAAARFEHTHNVVVLIRARQPLAPAPETPARIRAARPDDYAQLVEIDWAAFEPPWQLSPQMVGAALAQGDLITVAEAAGRIVGYQLSTPNRSGAHLARLAVRPEWQGRGIGTALTAHMIDHYQGRGALELSVNTQDSNLASLRVYGRLGFQPSGVRYPVFQLSLA